MKRVLAGLAVVASTALPLSADEHRGIRSGEGARITMNDTGALDHVCDYHRSMRGRIVAN